MKIGTLLEGRLSQAIYAALEAKVRVVVCCCCLGRGPFLHRVRAEQRVPYLVSCACALDTRVNAC